MKKAEDFKVGDLIYGKRITRISKYQIPSKVLHEYYATKYPNGMPGFIVESYSWGMTLFEGDEYPEECPILNEKTAPIFER